MVSQEICSGLWYVGAVDEALRTFGYASFTEAGVMYNSYLMDAGTKYLLIGTVPNRFVAEWIAEIRRLVGEKQIGWVVLFGSEEDRLAVNALLRCWPELCVLAGTNALFKLEGFVDGEYEKIEIRNSRKFAIGTRKLQFRVIQERFATASVYVLEEKEGILFTADVFGSSYASPDILLSRISDKEGFFRGVSRYISDIRGDERPKSIAEAITLVRENGVKLLCPAYGPVVDDCLERLLAAAAIEKAPKKEGLSLAVIYVPGNFTGELAQRIQAGASDAGITVEMYDLSAMSREEAIRGICRCDGYLFGTPEPQCDAAKAVWDAVTSLTNHSSRGKPAGVFTSSDSAGHAAEGLRQRLAAYGCSLTLRDFQTFGKPDLQMLKNAYEYGFGVGCSLRNIPNPHKPTLVKCLVCGEIFDASLGICPVCGAGLEQCVPVDEEEVGFRHSTQDRYVVLGGGVAAVSAAEAIRRRDETGSIVLFSAERNLPINRPMLTKDLDVAAAVPDTMFIHRQQWYDERKIELRLGCRIIAMDPKMKTITTEFGETYPYDKLIYATGAECFVPPFPGHDINGVLTIRHLEDCKELKSRMKAAARAVVIGGGVLGLEAASELMRSGLSVTVLEATPQIIGRQVDEEMAAIFRARMESLHVACFEGVSIAGIEGEQWVTGVRLTDGRVFPADIVIVSCGNRGNIQAAQAAGVATDRAIIVNERMETSQPDVYACGDCAQFDGVNYQLWQEASSQGRIAGANAAGEKIAYANQLMGLSLDAFGTALFAIGDAGKRKDIPYKTVETRDRVTGRYEKYWFYGNELQGAVLIGAPEKVMDTTWAVTTHAQHDDIFS